jgi:hypothetical protein
MSAIRGSVSKSFGGAHFGEDFYPAAARLGFETPAR